MSLQSGTQIGPYTIAGEVGRGGMGVVYRATDTRLDRAVAIKALPEELASDAGRLERFEREAKVLASLNHPNVAGIHGIEEQDGARYLVLEFVEGETLADRLDHGPIEIDEAIEFAVQIAAGVEAAHEAGIIHRDLKPANIKITPEGVAKVLDFGLAKSDEGSMSSTGSGFSQSPTMTTPQHPQPPQHSPTMEGAILGTAAYMSPEQARGRKVDKRTDIWSFGVVLYEMLTGASPFAGETASDSIGAVLHKPFNFDRLQRSTPVGVRRILTRCLERDKAKRYRDIGDVRLELMFAMEHAGDADSSVGAGRTMTPAGVAIAGVLLVVAAGIGWGGAQFFGSGVGSGGAMLADPFAQPLVVDLAAPEGYLIARKSGPPRFSPDGNRLALVVQRRPEGPGGIPSPGLLCIKDLTTGENTVYDLDEGLILPTWSPDGKSMMYGARGVIKVLDLETGRVRSEYAAKGSYPHGVEWGTDNILVTGAAGDRLPTIDMSTGQPAEPFAILKTDESGAGAPEWPTLLPDGDHYLYTYVLDETLTGVYLTSRSGDEHTRILIDEEVQTRYLASTGAGPGDLYYSLNGSIYRQPLDLETRSLLGEPELLADNAWEGFYPYFTPFDVDRNGRLVYFGTESEQPGNELVTVDIANKEETSTVVSGNLWIPSYSSDDRYIVLDITTDATAGDIYAIDTQRNAMATSISAEVVNETSPRWVGNDNKLIAFQSDGDLYLASLDGSVRPRVLLEGPEGFIPVTATPDGKSLFYVNNLSAQGQAVYEYNLDTGEKSRWLDIDFRHMRIGSQGDWVLTVTGSIAQSQLELRRFPEGTGRIVLDTGQSILSPRWAHDRSRIVYFKKDAFYTIDFTWPEPAENSSESVGSDPKQPPHQPPEPPSFADPVMLMHVPQAFGSFDINSDGTTLMYLKSKEQTFGESIRLIQN